MASRIPFLKIAQSRSTALKCFSTSPSTLAVKVSPFPELDLHLQDLHASLHKKVASIRTLFVAPDNHEIHDTDFIGAGVCVDPTLVLTSARVVGRVSPLHKAYIGHIEALFPDIEEPVKLAPAAVSFARDVAVLRVVGRRDLPVIPAAGSPPEKESILMSISYHQEDGWGISAANVRAAVGRRTVKAAAPWPLDDGAAWMEHDWMVFHRGPPPPSSVVFSAKEKVIGAITKLNGSPWFNLYGELVGISSWVLRDDPASFSVGYAAPLCNIWPVVEYAKTKGAEDPIVMDKWIKTEVINDEDQAT